MAKSEMGFLKFIVRPLYALTSVLLEDRLQKDVANLDESIIEWEKLQVKAMSEL
jgi:calcium/calmodulin-dependent 3',5'-cyclic nucleotide phosphodiesterase